MYIYLFLFHKKQEKNKYVMIPAKYTHMQNMLISIKPPKDFWIKWTE